MPFNIYEEIARYRKVIEESHRKCPPPPRRFFKRYSEEELEKMLDDPRHEQCKNGEFAP
jgi:hypothetical protein